ATDNFSFVLENPIGFVEIKMLDAGSCHCSCEIPCAIVLITSSEKGSVLTVKCFYFIFDDRDISGHVQGEISTYLVIPGRKFISPISHFPDILIRRFI